ncbi:hypothetical protein [Xanthomonas arboricola]|uniref:Uncharacterized protein n=1 Tax=Xanthomonas arboricola pv. guizotiae TaxID=487867 RepID=A0A2S6ZYB9_9XANT|nr:hypothetical protein [Xanthomonas arboricola]PPT98076.1 hypothetical protein XarbCFBP7409_13540 [Xanthomonas arboricola pv. guizotiae]PPU21524.1 hypothetical protein XarbCFBP7408_16500 [Xanthomonas arboricola pv. guizotiae]
MRAAVTRCRPRAPRSSRDRTAAELAAIRIHRARLLPDAENAQRARRPGISLQQPGCTLTDVRQRTVRTILLLGEVDGVGVNSTSACAIHLTACCSR